MNLLKYIFLPLIITLSFSQNTALEFDGSDDYVSIPENSAFKPTSALTLSAWIYLDDWTASNNFTPVSITQGGGYSFHFDNSDNIKFWCENAGGNSIIASYSVSSVSSGWHHVAGTFDGRYLKLYFDGDLKSTVDNGSTVTINYGDAK